METRRRVMGGRLVFVGLCGWILILQPVVPRAGPGQGQGYGDSGTVGPTAAEVGPGDVRAGGDGVPLEWIEAILKDREILESMELLDNLELFEDEDLFTPHRFE